MYHKCAIRATYIFQFANYDNTRGHQMKIFLPDFQFSSSNLMLPRIRLDVRQRFSQSEKFMFRIRSPLNPDTVEKEIQGQLTD